MQKVIDTHGFFREMSTEEFLKLGIRDIAYIRTIEDDSEKTAYSVHAADGTTLSVKNSLDLAISAVMQSDLAPITIH